MKFYQYFLIVWIALWSLVNLVQILYLYGEFDSVYAEYEQGISNGLGIWLISITMRMSGLAIGLTIIGLMSGVINKISKNKIAGNLNILMVLAPIYFFLVTILDLLGKVLLSLEDSMRDVIFGIAWLFPSIIMYVFFLFYIQYAQKHNAKIEASTATAA